MSDDNTALGFQAPWILLPLGTWFFLPNSVHCSPDSGSGEELPFPQSQQPSGALAGLGLAPAGTSLRSPLIESFLLLQTPSCFSAGPRIYTGLLVLPEHRGYHLSFPSVLEVFSFPGQRIPDEPPNVMPDVWIPEREERRLPRQCNWQKGEVYCCRASNAAVRGQSAEPKLLPNL